GRSVELPAKAIQLLHRLFDLLVSLCCRFRQSLILRRRRVRSSCRRSRLLSEHLGAAAGKVERQLHYLVGYLAIVIEEQDIARRAHQLLLRIELAVPDHSLVEKGNDVFARRLRITGTLSAGRDRSQQKGEQQCTDDF